MLLKFIKWFQGYLIVVLKGYSPERFINLCRNKDILLWDLKKTDGVYTFHITVKSFKKLRPIVKKTRTRPQIIKRTGLPFYISRYKKRKIFFFGMFLFVCIIYLLSLFVWDIEVSGQYSHTKENIITFLSDTGTYTGMKKSSIDCAAIETAIREKYNDIGWVSAELKGTRLLIKITETNMPVSKLETTKNSHIVASHDGIVTSIVTRSGTPQVKQGDVVKKGDILISGILDITGDDNITAVKKEPVIADGDIILKTNYEYNQTFDLNYKNRQYTDRSYHEYGFRIFNKEIFFSNILKKFESYENYDIIVNDNALKFGDSFYLPFSTLNKQVREYTETDQQHSKEEAETIAKDNLERYLTVIKNNGVEVLDKKVTLSINGHICTVSGKITVNEPQKEYKEINESEWSVEATNEPDRKNN